MLRTPTAASHNLYRSFDPFREQFDRRNRGLGDCGSKPERVAPITITTFSGSLKGTYVLQAQGVDNSGATDYQFAGAVVLDGNGGITSGEQTINFFDQQSGALVSKSDSIVAAPNSYFIGSDGRGTITITTSDTNDYGSAIQA